jgi:hypothetical protein
MYLVTASFAVAQGVVTALGALTDVMRNSETEWILTFALSNLFVLMVTYLHWTYEPDKHAYSIATNAQLGGDEVGLAEPDVDRSEDSLLVNADKEKVMTSWTDLFLVGSVKTMQKGRR